MRMPESPDQLSVALSLSLACQVEAIRPAARRVVDFLKDQHLSAQEIQACELAVVEACNNAVRYARPETTGESVTIEISCGRERVELRVEDHTPGFEFPQAIALPEPEQESGRGLFLIRSVMDKADYLRGTKGNCLVM